MARINDLNTQLTILNSELCFKFDTLKADREAESQLLKHQHSQARGMANLLGRVIHFITRHQLEVGIRSFNCFSSNMVTRSLSSKGVYPSLYKSLGLTEFQFIKLISVRNEEEFIMLDTFDRELRRKKVEEAKVQHHPFPAFTLPNPNRDLFIGGGLIEPEKVEI